MLCSHPVVFGDTMSLNYPLVAQYLRSCNGCGSNGLFGLKKYHPKKVTIAFSTTLSKGEIHIMQKSKWLLGTALVISLGLAGCGKEKPPVVGSGEPLEAIVEAGLENKALLRVNERPVTQYDFNLWQLSTKQGQATPEQQRKLLDRIVEAELMYQRGIELGLDKDPVYVRAFALAAAKNKMLKLQQMEEMVVGHEAGSVKIEDEQAKAYYDANEADIRSVFDFGSLQFATEKEARDALKRIRKSKSFETVADEIVATFPDYDGVKEPREYWEMKGVSWQMIPPNVMRAVGKMKLNDVSEPIAANDQSFIILKLLAKQTVNERDFPSMRAAVISRLRDEAVVKHIETLRKELKAKAKIEKLDTPTKVDMMPVPESH